MNPSQHREHTDNIARLYELAELAGDFDDWAAELKRPYDWQEDGL